MGSGSRHVNLMTRASMMPAPAHWTLHVPAILQVRVCRMYMYSSVARAGGGPAAGVRSAGLSSAQTGARSKTVSETKQ